MDLVLLQRLLDAYGVSGFEDRIRNEIVKEMNDLVDEIHVDKLGNLICHKKGKGPKIMLAAHMDEIGLIVREIKENGRIMFSILGGIEPITLIGQKVHIETAIKNRPLHGIISFGELHDGKEISDRTPKPDRLFVDTGIGKKELVKKGVRIGNFIVAEQKSYFAGNNEIISGKALDDRIGCYLLIMLARRMKKNPQGIYYVFTVQEEIGLYGAKTSAFEVEPDIAVAVDVTNAGDSESSDANAMGRGPFITIKDSEMISNRALVNHFVNLSKAKKIPLQLEVTDFGTTDAMYISISRSGVPATVIGVVVRNIHSTIGLASLKDVEKCLALLEAFLKKPPVFGKTIKELVNRRK
ncbi:MAG: M42 family peptidase [Candidatus Diapherotrites archaeon]|nr:M42 family peptidase [Candidatus Diapherotrites archaeon]